MVELNTHSIEEFKAEFPGVFQDGIGFAPKTVSLTLKDDAKPVLQKHRSVPYALQQHVERELSKLVSEGVLVQVFTYLLGRTRPSSTNYRL